MGRSPASDENGLKKGPWLSEEDDKLISYIQKHGHSSWSALPKLAGLNRCGKSCRLRWTNYLRPDIKRGRFSGEEEQIILNLHEVLGNKWSMIASHLPGRTDNEIKNFWNTHLKKKLIQMGFDPMTHRPRTDDIFSNLSHLMSLSNLKVLVDLHQQFPTEEQALLNLQTEISKLQLFHYLLQPPLPSINLNDLNILNLLTKENSNASNVNIGFLTSYLQEDFNNNLPSLKALEETHSSPMLLHEPPSLNQTMLPSHNPSTLSDDLLPSVDGFCCNQASSSHDEERAAATASEDWPDHLFDDSIFPDIISYHQS